MNILVNHGGFIQSGGEEFHAVFLQQSVHVGAFELPEGRSAAHDPPRPVRTGTESFLTALAAHDECRGTHGAGHDAESACIRGCRSLAVDDDAFTVMLFLPCEIVVVFHMSQLSCAKRFQHMGMDQLMVGRGIAAHELHGRPVFLPRLAVQIKPGQTPQAVRQTGAQRHGSFAVMQSHAFTRASAAGMTEEREV